MSSVCKFFKDHLQVFSKQAKTSVIVLNRITIFSQQHIINLYTLKPASLVEKLEYSGRLENTNLQLLNYLKSDYLTSFRVAFNLSRVYFFAIAAFRSKYVIRYFFISFCSNFRISNLARLVRELQIKKPNSVVFSRTHTVLTELRNLKQKTDILISATRQAYHLLYK